MLYEGVCFTAHQISRSPTSGRAPAASPFDRMAREPAGQTPDPGFRSTRLRQDHIDGGFPGQFTSAGRLDTVGCS